MNLGEAVERIRFSTATADDITGRSANTQFPNNVILQQLKFALDEFAKRTKCIEDIMSQPVSTEQNFIDYPTLALRTKGIKGVIYFLNTLRYQLSVQNIANTYNNYPINNTSGVPACVLPYGSGREQKLEIFPRPQQGANDTTLSETYTKGDSNISLVNGAGFLLYKGRITIGTTKFEYVRMTANVLYDVRVVEQTEDETYGVGEVVKTNNMWIYYARLHVPFATNVKDITDMIDLEIEIPEEYMEAITDYTAYKLLLKISPERAEAYRMDWDTLVDDAEYAIANGRGIERRSGSKREASSWESGLVGDLL